MFDISGNSDYCWREWTTKIGDTVLRSPTSPPVLHLPLRLPSLQSSTTKTPWSTIAIDIRPLLPLFASTHLQKSVRNETIETRQPISRIWPSSKFESIAYVKVYATCRLRRIWFSKDGKTDGPHNAWEFGLYGSQ
ncbi:hypothetical protein FRC03_006909 [Tulasnella sp. 419]|nr:hypothetical protein FRC03_006909 [Tulasnella sp. 419]